MVWNLFHGTWHIAWWWLVLRVCNLFPKDRYVLFLLASLAQVDIVC